MNFIRMTLYYRKRGYTWRNAISTAWSMTRT